MLPVPAGSLFETTKRPSATTAVQNTALESRHTTHLIQNRLKKNGQLQLQVLPAAHSDQPKGSHIKGTRGLSCSLTGYDAVLAMPHRPPLPTPTFNLK